MKKITPARLSVSFVYDDSLDGWEGVAQYVKTLGGWLQARGHRVSYMVGQSELKEFQGAPVYSLARNIGVRFNGNRLRMPLFASKREIKRAIQQERPDILHVQVPYSPLLAQKIIKNSAASAVVGTFHIYPTGRLVYLAAKLLRGLYGRSLNRFTTMASVSRPAQRFAHEAFGISSTIIPNLVDIDRYLKTATATTPGKIVFLGRLVERKGCAYLIRAFAKVSKKNPGATLVIAGGGPERQSLERLAAMLGVKDRVEFLGFIDESDKPGLLASAAIACFPSTGGESFGIVLVEAMAAGAGAVIGGNNPGYAYVLEDNPTVLFNPKDIDALALKIDGLLRQPALLKAIRAEQAELVRKYDVNIVGKQIEDMYRSAIANSRQTGDNNS